jgi:hypothetical protein
MRKLGFCQSLLIGVKKCAPSLPEDMVTDAIGGCLDRYTEVVPRQGYDVIQSVLRQCRHITRNFTPRLSEEIQDFSLRSTLESKRIDSGSYGEAVRTFGKKDSWNIVTGGHSEESGLRLPSRSELLEEVGFTYLAEFVEDEDVYAAGSGILQDYTYHQTTCPLPLNREVVGLCEPLKVRCITISHWWESPLWAPLQKQLLRFLSKRPEVCSGKVLEEDYFDDLVQAKDELEARIREEGTPCEFVFVSDDGDAATDSICLQLSNESIRDIIPEDLLEIYDICSGITYDCEVMDNEELFEPMTQVNSQLMGDRLSFVKLTVIHLAFKLVFMRRMARFYEIPLWLWRRCIKINGDDGLVAIPRRFVKDYLSWMDNLWGINRIKTQVSTRVFTLNSRMWQARNGQALEVPFLRLNLIERVDRGGNFLINPQVWNEILRDLNGSKRQPVKVVSEKRTWRMFHRNWTGTLEFLCKGKGNNYFLPEIVGGLGLIPPSSLHFWTTARQNHAIACVESALNKELRPPKFRTKVVPVSAPLDGISRKTTVIMPQGVVNFPTQRPVFSGTARVKEITVNTKLFTYKLPKIKILRLFGHVIEEDWTRRPSLNTLATWTYGNLHSTESPTVFERYLHFQKGTHETEEESGQDF